MMLLCFIASGLQAARAADDITSAFNKAFLEQLGPNQGQAGQAIEIMQPGAGREAQLDRELQRMVSGPGYTVEVVSEDAGGMPAQIRQLFPGPLQFDIDGSSQPFREPDPLVMDMLSSVNQAVQEMVTPVLHQTQHASSAPGSCQKDAAAHCSTARSQVHCLGQHRADISDDCRRDLGKSVPFVCSGPIDKHCDVLHVGILDCLQRYQEELAGDCKDAFLATSKAIQSLNTAAPKAPVAQAAQVTVSTAPSAISKPGLADRERSLDSQLSKLTGLKVNKVPAATVASAIQKAEKQAEDQLAQDADKIESLLSQMSDKISKNQPPSSHWPSSRVMLLVSILLLIAYFYFQSEDGRKAFLKLRMMLHSGGGRPFLKRNDMGFGEEVPL